MECFIINAIADAAAGAAVESANASTANAEWIGATMGRAVSIIKRLAFIEASRWAVGDGLLEMPKALIEFLPRNAVDDAALVYLVLAQHDHFAVVEGVWTRCTRCSRGRKRDNAAFWTLVPCPGYEGVGADKVEKIE